MVQGNKVQNLIPKSRYITTPATVGVEPRLVAVAKGEKIHHFLLKVVHAAVLPALVHRLIFARQNNLRVHESSPAEQVIDRANSLYTALTHSVNGSTEYSAVHSGRGAQTNLSSSTAGRKICT